MPTKRRNNVHGGIGSDAVKKATGRGWKEWFTLMDRAGCATMNHKQIVAFLARKHEVGPWWQQMVTVGYEQARGLRDRHQKTTGYEVSACKTLNVSPSVAYMWWAIEKCRAKWLTGVDVKIHKKTPSKSLRLTWNASAAKPAKSISIGLYPKGKGKSKTTMAIQHGKLASAAEAKRMKAYWAARLARLERLIAEETD